MATPRVAVRVEFITIEMKSGNYITTGQRINTT